MSSTGKEAGLEVPHDTENCVICLSPISEKSVASPCRHSYDYLCLLSWLEVRQSCPLCNTTVEHIDVVDASSGKLNRHKVSPPRETPTPFCDRESLSLRDRSLRSRSRSHHHRPRHRRTPSPIPESVAVLRRRFIYKHQLRSSHVGSNRISRFQNFTPLSFLRDPELQSRARNFIRRELQVFEWIQTDNNSEFLLEYVIGLLKSVDLKSASGATEDMLTDFLGRRNARVFLHELHAFLRSPYTNLSHFDAFAQYAVPVPTSFPEGEDLEVANGGDEAEDGSEVPRAGHVERTAVPGRWRKEPYSRERDRPRPYDSYRPSY